MLRRISSFLKSYGEMRRGEEFVMREVARTRARTRALGRGSRHAHRIVGDRPRFAEIPIGGCPPGAIDRVASSSISQPTSVWLKAKGAALAAPSIPSPRGVA